MDHGCRCSPALKMSVNMNDACMKPIRFGSRDQTHGGAPRSPLVASIRSLEGRARRDLGRLRHHAAPAFGARNWAAIADQAGAGFDAAMDFWVFWSADPKGAGLKPISRAASATTNVVAKSVDVSSTPTPVVGALNRWGDA